MKQSGPRRAKSRPHSRPTRPSSPGGASHQTNIESYLERREIYQDRLLRAAEVALPGIRGAIELAMPGTPVTFESYTGRPMGMVGGFPQTSLFAARGPKPALRTCGWWEIRSFPANRRLG